MHELRLQEAVSPLDLNIAVAIVIWTLPTSSSPGGTRAASPFTVVT